MNSPKLTVKVETILTWIYFLVLTISFHNYKKKYCPNCGIYTAQIQRMIWDGIQMNISYFVDILIFNSIEKI